MARRYWLFKSDPDTYGLKHLKREAGQSTIWDGVRNYQARNLLRDEIREGDGILFYHSQITPPAVVATARVIRAGYPDPTQFDRREKYFDPKAKKDLPRWYAVDIRLDREFDEPVPLPRLRETAGLGEMVLLQKGSRLSIQPVRAAEWKIVLRLAGLRKR